MNKLSVSDFNKFPKHWRLSESHYLDINRHVSEYYKFLEKFTNNDSTIRICKLLVHQYKQYEYIVNELVPIPLKNSQRDLILDDNMIKKILHYIILDIFTFVESNIPKMTKNNFVILLKDMMII